MTVAPATPEIPQQKTGVDEMTVSTSTSQDRTSGTSGSAGPTETPTASARTSTGAGAGADDAASRATAVDDSAVKDSRKAGRSSAAPDQDADRAVPPRSGGRSSSTRPKRPVDVFFDGAPSQAADSSDDSGSSTSEGRTSTPRNRSGRRSVSAEAMENALARGSRAGRSLGPRNVAPAPSGDSETSAEAVADETDAAPSVEAGQQKDAVEISTPVDNVGGSIRDASAEVSRETLVEVPGAVFAEIAVTDIQPNPRQPRSVFDEDEMGELVHSIRTIGVLQPIVVRRRSAGSGYELVMGERRWRATQRAGLDTIPAIVRTTDDTDMLRDALLENLHRSQLNPLEEAAAYQQLLDDFAATHDELASRIGRSRPQISNTLRLLQLPPLVQRRVAAGVLSAGHARALLSLADAAEIEKLAQRIVSEGMSVRATEEAVALSDGLKRSPRSATPRNSVRHERLDYLATSLSDYFDTSVKVSLGARKGKVSIEFGSVEDLNRIIDMISPDVRQ
ncbi:ParB/RepB/Spo0J family partition protein [Tersicoccus sp. MR15.9]|uniref:ParB/RepB/Spo0J family partition protein n=1 Tax=Tersicoccus mangrovi TaxID=3121635 RepID=UPI002FE5C5EA